MPKKNNHKGQKGFVFEITAKCEAMVQADRCAAAAAASARCHLARGSHYSYQPTPVAFACVRRAQSLGGSVCVLLPWAPQDHVRWYASTTCCPAHCSSYTQLTRGHLMCCAGAVTDESGMVVFEDALEGMMVTLYKVRTSTHCTNVCTHARTRVRAYTRTHGCMDARTHGRTDAYAYKRTLAAA